MTEAEKKVAWLTDELWRDEAAVRDTRDLLQNARNDLFRERHDYSAGDWALYDEKPVFVARIVNFPKPEDDFAVLHGLTKEGKIGSLAMRESYGARVIEHIAPWPVGRPLPEVKP